MSIVDQVISALTPPETDEARREATAKARAAAIPGDWLSSILDHHDAIRGLFVEARTATTAEAQQQAQARLAALLTAHAIAEEVAVYPVIAAIGDTGHATMAYTEQSAAKMQMGLLERLAPMSKDYLDKLGHIEGAVLHHMYEEEGSWFLDIKQQAAPDDEARAAAKYADVFGRYAGREAQGGAGSNAAPAAGSAMGETSAGGHDIIA